MAETTADAPASPPARRPLRAAPRALKRQEILMVAGGALLLLDVAFFVLGRMYYMDKLEGAFFASDIADPEGAAASAAWAYTQSAFFWGFFAFSTVGTAAVTAAVLWPRQLGHALAAAFGAYFIVSAVLVVTKTHMPFLIAVFQAAVGALFLRLTWVSWKQRDRAAWAFLLSLAGVLTVMLLFGAPQIRKAMDVPRLWYVMILPALMAATAVGLSRDRGSY